MLIILGRLVLVILIAFVILYIVSLYMLVKFKVDDAPLESDLVIVVYGDEVSFMKAREFVSDGFVKTEKVLICDRNSDVRGLNPSDTLVEDEKVNLFLKAHNVYEMMGVHDFESAIIVTPDYQMLRVQNAFKRMNQEFKLNFVSSYQTVDGVSVPWFKAREAWALGVRESLRYIRHVMSYTFTN